MSRPQVSTNYEIQIHQMRSDGEHVLVKGHMPEEIEFGAEAEWEAPFSEGLLGMLPGAVSGALKMFGVRPATQLMTLQVWQGSKSNDLTFNLTFTTFSDPFKDVMEPVLKLMSFVTPSVDTTGFLMSPGPTLDPEKAKELVQTVIAQAKEIASGVATIAEQFGGATGNAVKSVATPGTMTDSEKKATPEKQSGVRASNAEASKLKNQLVNSVKNRISIVLGRFLFIRDITIVAATPNWNMTYLDARTGMPNMCTVSVIIRPLFAVTTQDLESMFQLSENRSTLTDYSA